MGDLFTGGAPMAQPDGPSFPCSPWIQRGAWLPAPQATAPRANSQGQNSPPAGIGGWTICEAGGLSLRLKKQNCGMGKHSNFYWLRPILASSIGRRSCAFLCVFFVPSAAKCGDEPQNDRHECPTALFALIGVPPSTMIERRAGAVFRWPFVFSRLRD